MTTLRRILVYFGYFLAAVLFVLLAGYAVLIASGYKVNWQEKTLIKTGVLAVNSLPPRATLFINNKLFSRSTPLSLKYLLPGEYDIRIEKEGFLPYKNRVEVKTDLITDLRETILFLEEPPSEKIELDFTPKSLASFNKEKTLLQDEKGRIFVYADQKASPFIETWPKSLASLSQWKLGQVKVSESGKTAVLLLTQGQSRRFVIWQNDKAPRLLERSLPESLDELIVEDDRLFAFSQSAVWSFELEDLTPQALLKNVLGFGFSDGKFLAVQKDKAGVLKLLEISGKGEILRELEGDLPVANHYKLFRSGDFLFVHAATSRASTLWLYRIKNSSLFQRLTGDFTGPILEIGKDFIYQSKNELFALNKETEEQTPIASLATPIILEGSFRRNLFFLQGNALRTVDLLGGGLNTLLNLEQPAVFISPEAKEAFTLMKEGLMKYELRREG